MNCFFPDVDQLPKSQSWRFGSFRTTEAAEQVSCSFPRLAGLLSKSVYNEDFVVPAALQDRDWALFRRLRRRRWKAPVMEANSTRYFSIEMNHQNWEVAEARVHNQELFSIILFLPPFHNDFKQQLLNSLTFPRTMQNSNKATNQFGCHIVSHNLCATNYDLPWKQAVKLER